jgi:hypothetical protein
VCGTVQADLGCGFLGDLFGWKGNMVELADHCNGCGTGSFSFGIVQEVFPLLVDVFEFTHFGDFIIPALCSEEREEKRRGNAEKERRKRRETRGVVDC